MDDEKSENSLHMKLEEDPLHMKLEEDPLHMKLEEDPLHMKLEDDHRKITTNPFVHHYYINSNYDRFKVLFMSIFVLPIRILLLVIVLITGYIISSVGLWGLSKEELNGKPFTGFRLFGKTCMSFLGRSMMRLYGFQWLKITGKQASRTEAPIIVVGPHSSFMDAIAVFWCGMPGLVNRVENIQIPLFGKYISFSQPVYVRRGDSSCRMSTIQEIEKRARSKDDWPQIMIYPEGTCTNRSCLITFKPGGFYPGVPVQPLLIRYPNRSDCFTWTWDGPGALKIIWATLCQIHNYCELEYLPVYHPNEQEVKDPHLYASNVRKVMADALGVSVVDYTYDDCRLMHKAKLKKLPCNVGLIGVQNIRQNLGLPLATIENEILDHFAAIADVDGIIRIKDLSKYLGIPTTESVLVQLFNLYDELGSGEIEFKNYLVGYSKHVLSLKTEEIVTKAFSVFDKGNKRYITRDDVVEALKTTLNLPEKQSETIFQQADVFHSGRLEYEDFLCYAKRKPEYILMFVMYQRSIKEGHRTGVSSAIKSKAE